MSHLHEAARGEQTRGMKGGEVQEGIEGRKAERREGKRKRKTFCSVDL